MAKGIGQSIVVLLLYLCVPGICACASTWSPPSEPLMDTKADQWSPKAVISTDRSVWLALMGIDGTTGDEIVRVCHYADGSWNHNASIGSGNRAPDRFPEIACGADGLVWVLWTSFDGAGGFAGLLTCGGDSGWSPPDTVWTGGHAHDTYSMAVDTRGEVWVVRDGIAGPRSGIEVYRILSGAVIATRVYGAEDANLFLPRAAAGNDGDVWLLWKAIPPLDPHKTRVEWVKMRGDSEWPTQQTYEGVVGLNRAGFAVDSSGVPWLVASGRSPGVAVEDGSVFAAPWNGSNWGEPVRISDPLDYGKADQYQLSITSTIGSCAAWIAGRRGIESPTTVLLSFLSDSGWTSPVAVGSASESTEKSWPYAIMLDSTNVVAFYMERRPGSAAHAIKATIGRVSVFSSPRHTVTALGVPSGTRVSWAISPERRVERATMYRSDDMVCSDPPSGRGLVKVSEWRGEAAQRGVFLDGPRESGGDYWISLAPQLGPDFWLGPAADPSGTVRTGQGIVTVSPNPENGTYRFLVVRPESKVSGLMLVSVRGQVIRRLIAADEPSTDRTRQVFTWDGRTQDGRAAPCGVYFIVPEGSTDAARASRFVLLR
jgi:hypothetical protein